MASIRPASDIRFISAEDACQATDHGPSPYWDKIIPAVRQGLAEQDRRRLDRAASDLGFPSLADWLKWAAA